MDAGKDQKNLSPSDLQALKLRERDRIWEYRFVWFLLIAFLVIAGYHYLHSQVDGTLRQQLTSMLAQRLPQHLVAIDSAHLAPGRGIVIEGLRISLPTSDGPRLIVRVPRLVARGDLQLVGLIQGEVPLDRVYLDSIDVSLWPTEEGLWSIQTLANSDPIPINLPPIEVRRGLIRLCDETNSSDQELIFHDFTASLNNSVQDLVRMQASLKSSYFQNLSVSVELARDKSQWNIVGKVNHLFYSSQLIEKLPTQWSQYLRQLSGFQGKASLTFSVQQASPEQPKFEVHADIADGRLQHPSLPYPLDGLSGKLYCRNNLLQLRQATAKSGDASFSLEADVHGLSIGVPLFAKLKAVDLPLDDRLYRAISPALQEQWSKFQVAGMVDAEATLEYDGKEWHPDVVVQARNGSVHPDLFPYPITHIFGEFKYREGIFTSSEILAQANGQTVRGAVKLERAFPKWLVDFAVSSDTPIPIDETMLSALTPRGEPKQKAEEFVRSLSPTGKVHIERARFVRTADNIDHVQKEIELGFYGGSIRYSGFRYPVFEVDGHVTIRDEMVFIDRFRGRNDSARIHCEGYTFFKDAEIDDLALRFDVYNLPLEEELQAALPETVKHIWKHLRPSGIIDRVMVDLTKNNEANQFGDDIQLTVAIREDGRADTLGGRTVSIQPLAMPYLWSDISCDIRYRPGVVEIRNFGGSHDASLIRAKGECYVHPDGAWFGKLEWLPTSRINVDQGLLATLPEYFRSPLQSSEFRGPIGLTGHTVVASVGNSREPSIQAWDMQLEIEDGRLANGQFANGIRGTIHVQGEHSSTNPGTTPVAVGTLAIDSLSFRGIPVLKLNGPFAIVESKLLLGRTAAQVKIPPLDYRFEELLSQKFSSTRGQFATVATGQSFGNSSGNHASDVVPAGFIMNRDVPLLGRLRRNQNDGNSEPVPAVLVPTLDQPSDALLLDDSQISGGADRTRFWQPPPPPILDVRTDDLKAKALSGSVYLYGIHPLVEGRTEVNVALVDANFFGLLADLGEASSNASGRLWMECRLSGSFMHANTLSGVGKAWLRNANLYQLPVMTRLFRVLSMRQPDDGAFETADVSFRIDGDQIPIDKISLDGDILSLRGSGHTSLRRDLHLDLFAYVAKRSAIGAILGPMVIQNDNATMLQLEVTGTTDNPQFRRSLPIVGSSMQQTFPDRTSSNLPR